MTCWNKYYTPTTIEEAVRNLASHGGRAVMIGGGTDMLLEIQQGHRPPVEALVDLKNVEGLNRISEDSGYIVIGGAVTHTQIVNDARIASRGTCLVESCGVIGGPQVRNVGTLAGNIAHALPAGDGTIGLLALGGDLQIAGESKLDWVPMEKTFLGPGKSTINPGCEFIARMRFKPSGPGEASAFRRVMRPQGVALPMIGMAAWIKLDGAKISAARITIGPAGSVPFIAQKTMAFLIGKPATDATFADAAKTALTEVHLRTSAHRASAAYREEMIRVQLPKTLAKAAERARTGKAEPEGVGL